MSHFCSWKDLTPQNYGIHLKPREFCFFFLMTKTNSEGNKPITVKLRMLLLLLGMKTHRKR